MQQLPTAISISKHKSFLHILHVFTRNSTYLNLYVYYIFRTPPAFLTQFLDELKKESIRELREAFLKVSDAAHDRLDDKLKKAEEEMRESLAKVQALPEN